MGGGARSLMGAPDRGVALRGIGSTAIANGMESMRLIGMFLS
jgi:hypothetical protein